MILLHTHVHWCSSLVSMIGRASSRTTKRKYQNVHGCYSVVVLSLNKITALPALLLHSNGESSSRCISVRCQWRSQQFLCALDLDRRCCLPDTSQRPGARLGNCRRSCTLILDNTKKPRRPYAPPFLGGVVADQLFNLSVCTVQVLRWPPSFSNPPLSLPLCWISSIEVYGEYTCNL
jgi:hypothetical protein